MQVVNFLLFGLMAVLSIPVLVLFFQVFLSMLPRKSRIDTPNDALKFAVLMPAHNESSGIQKTIFSVLPHLRAVDRLLVVADNCTDDTAEVARKAGAEVIERFNLEKRGKGFALDFGVQHLRTNPPDVVIVVDADCLISRGGLRDLASLSHKIQRPVQSLYLMLSTTEASLKTKIAEFAWLVKNLVRPTGFAKLGLPCPLMGSGMAFPWGVISNAQLANDNIVEDLKLGIELAKSGRAPYFYPDTLVTSFFPNNTEAQAEQRKRWEHGHLNSIFVEAPKLVFVAIKKMDIALLSLALDLIVPPVALLVILLVSVSAIIFAAYFLNFVTASLLIFMLTIFLIFVITMIGAWWRWGKHILPFQALLMAPMYVLGKIPHYLLYVVKRQKKWVRTNRD